MDSFERTAIFCTGYLDKMKHNSERISLFAWVDTHLTSLISGEYGPTGVVLAIVTALISFIVTLEKLFVDSGRITILVWILIVFVILFLCLALYALYAAVHSIRIETSYQQMSETATRPEQGVSEDKACMSSRPTVES